MARKPIRFSFTGDTTGLAGATRAAAGNLQQLANEASRTNRELSQLGNETVTVSVDASALDKLKSRLEDSRRNLITRIETDVDIDPTEALRQLNRIDRQIRQVDRKKIDIGLDMSTVATAAAPAAGRAISALASNPYVLAGAATFAAGLGAAILPTAVTLGIGGGVIAGFYELASAWDSLDKNAKKVNIVFGDQADAIREWANAASTNLGLGKRQIEGIAAGVQDLLVPRGFSRATAADITKIVVERGAALAEFSGRETADGIDAITKALLGQTDSLTSLGVQLNAAEIESAMKALSNKDGFTNLNESQLKTLATLDLIKQKSSDAWTAFNEGGSQSDSLLDKWAATWANLKTDAIEGFGSVLETLFGDVAAEFNISFNDGGLKEWIDANKDNVTQFFYDMASAALVAVDTVFVLGDAFITMASDALSGLSIVLGGIREWANVMSFVSLAIPGIGGQVSAAWESLSTGADNAKTSVDGLKTGFDIAGNGIKTAMSGGRQSIDALKNAVDAANAKRIQLRVDTDSVATARETIASLTKTRYAYVNIITRKGAIGSGAFARPAYSDGNLFAPNSAAPQVNVFLQDERLSDLIGVTVDGQNVATQQTELRRWGAPI